MVGCINRTVSIDHPDYRRGEAGTDGDYIVTAGLLLWGTGTHLKEQ